VDHVGERFGVEYLTMRHKNTRHIFSAEGKQLGNYQIRPGMNIILRGKVYMGILVDVSLVTPQEVDTACAAS
jgi:hypothetical protein